MCVCVSIKGLHLPPPSTMSVEVKGTWMDRWWSCMNNMICGFEPINSENTGVHVTAVLLWLKLTEESPTENPSEFLADAEWPRLQFERFEPWEFLRSVNNTERSKSPHVTINLCAQIYRAQGGLWLDTIKYLLHGWSPQPVSHGSLVICAHDWSPPLCLCPTPECR